MFSKMFSARKAQLGWIEFKYFLVGLIIGAIAIYVLIVLAKQGIVPFKMPFV